MGSTNKTPNSIDNPQVTLFTNFFPLIVWACVILVEFLCYGYWGQWRKDFLGASRVWGQTNFSPFGRAHYSEKFFLTPFKMK